MKIYHWKSNLLDYDISASAKLIGFVLSEFYREGKDCYPGVTTLLEVSGLGSRNTVLKSIKELEKFKIIKITKKRKPGNSRESNVYRFVGVDNEPSTEPPSEPIAEPSTELSTDGSKSIPSTELETTITKTTKEGVKPPLDSSHLISTPPYTPHEEKKGVLKQNKKSGGAGGVGDLVRSLAKSLKPEWTTDDVMKELNEYAVNLAKQNAPGWDLNHLASVYVSNLNGGKEPPRSIRAAFPEWCGTYTKGRRP